MNKFLTLGILVSIILNIWLFTDRGKLIKSRDKYRQNTETLLSDIRQYKLDSTRIATETSRLQLTIEEYKRYKEEDTKTIKELGISIKRLKASIQHQASVNVPINVPVKDSVVYKDSLIMIPTIKLSNKYVNIDAIIENNTLKGSMSLDVQLKQFVYVEPKHRFLWFKWGVKGINQVIISDNPYVKINYSEFIEINKK
mgnify:FL=1